MSRPQIHAYGLTALLLFVIALGVALAMLGHATMAGGPQWSAGALAGVIVAGTVIVVVTLAVGFNAVGEWARRDRATAVPDTAWFMDQWAADDASWYDTPHWARQTADEIVYELGEAQVDELVAQRSRRRHAARR